MPMSTEHSGKQAGNQNENGTEINTQAHSPVKGARARVYNRKWKTLESKGYKKPKSFEENKQRAREAHTGKMKK